MLYSIENEDFKVVISTKGAELQSVYSKVLNTELLWQGDKSFWGKKSPILFPIIGELKNGTYEYDTKMYQLPRHGFARDMEFNYRKENINTIAVFELQQNQTTLQVFPFKFKLLVTYALINDCLMAMYSVQNTSNSSILYASVGAHPAFNVPIFPDTNFNDYTLLFNKNETAGVYPITENGLIKTQPTNFFDNTNEIKLHKELFYGDALVFKDLKSSIVKLVHQETGRGFDFTFTNQFNYFGIWSAKDAPFVCLEPWSGIADNENASGKIQNKEGISSILPGETINAMWNISAI